MGKKLVRQTIKTTFITAAFYPPLPPPLQGLMLLGFLLNCFPEWWLPLQWQVTFTPPGMVFLAGQQWVWPWETSNARSKRQFPPPVMPVKRAHQNTKHCIVVLFPSLLVLNIGSASQLAVIKPAASSSSSSSSSSVAAAGDGNDLVLPPSLMEVPYFGGDSLLVAASLTGANALSLLVETLRKWMEELGVKSEAIPSDEELYGKVFSLAEEKLESTLSVQVTLWGERHDTGLRGAASNVEPESLSLGDVASATLRGVLENLRAMMPNHILKTLQVYT